MDKKKSEIDWKLGDVAIIKEGWDEARRLLFVLGPAVYVEQWWVPVIDYGMDPDPTFHKEAGLELTQFSWIEYAEQR